MREKVDLIGAVLTYAIYINVILIFIVRLLKKASAERWLGLVLMLAAVPLVYLLAAPPSLRRPAIYYVQVCLMLAYLIVELLLDYILKIDFRSVRWMVIAYVVIFFAGTGGMIGVAARAGRAWTIPAILLFLVMAVLAFVQRGITGM